MRDHVHVLTDCHECDGSGELNGSLCSYCDARGYVEFCRICREPMGNKRRKWKREQAVRAVAEVSGDE